ncbi:MAG: transcription antitermination factor NusB [Candidatus Aminicenantes bacterium]|nr:transcription antitermination factor NusB [Candidatus Aminicenantes bacterium]
MGRRRRARECALQLLYELEFHENEIESLFENFWKERKEPEDIKEYSEWLVRGVVRERAKIDEAIQKVSKNWRLSRMAVVDRNILRLATFELEAEPHLDPAIIINEAIELAKKFSGEEAAHFVNGLLDALKRKREQEKIVPVVGQEASQEKSIDKNNNKNGKK